MFTLNVVGGTDRLKPSLNEKSKRGNHIIKMIMTRSVPPKPYLIIAFRFCPRGVGYFYNEVMRIIKEAFFKRFNKIKD